MRRLITFACITLSFCTESVASVPTEQVATILQLVDQDATVLKARREARSAAIDVQLTEISGSPTVDFATRGRYPITSEIDDVRDRFSDLDAEYIDGVVTLNVPLTDFGRRDAETDAGQLRYQAAQIGVDIVRQETLADLLQMAIRVQRAESGIDVLTRTLAQLEKRVENAKARYSGGTGTLATVRTLELRRLELDSSLKEAEYEVDLTQRSFLRRFDVNLERIQGPLVAFAETLALSDQPFDVERVDSQSQLYLEQSALRFDAVAVQKSQLPEINGTITGTLFNIDSRLGNAYDVVGGLNASLPLVDSGARDAQLSQIALRTEILQEELALDRDERSDRWDENGTRRTEIQAQISKQTKRFNRLRDEVEELALRSQTLDGRPVDLALTEVDLGLVEVDLARSTYDWLDAMVDAFLIRDDLLLSLIGQSMESHATHE